VEPQKKEKKKKEKKAIFFPPRDCGTQKVPDAHQAG
jgi:hypothetical protein